MLLLFLVCSRKPSPSRLDGSEVPWKTRDRIPLVRRNSGRDFRIPLRSQELDDAVFGAAKAENAENGRTG